MNSNLGIVIVVEDDLDDQQFITDIFNKFKYTNPLKFFRSGEDALRFLENIQEPPFLILSDIMMPGMNGLEFREKIRESNNVNKNTPFIFFTTSYSDTSIKQAYSSSIQGFFQKPTSFSDLEHIIQIIMNYWTGCISPFSIHSNLRYK